MSIFSKMKFVANTDKTKKVVDNGIFNLVSNNIIAGASAWYQWISWGTNLDNRPNAGSPTTLNP